MSTLIWPQKDPKEIKDYDVEWTIGLYSPDELAQYQAAVIADPTKDLPTDPSTVVMPADRIQSSTFTLPPGATLVANSTTNTGLATKVWLAGGDEGESYSILNEVVTVGGRTADRRIKLKVKSK